MGEEDVRIPIFLDLEETDFEKKLGKLEPKLSKLKSAISDVYDSRSSELKDPVDIKSLNEAIQSLDEIRQKVLSIGEINMSDEDWGKAFDSYQNGVEVLDNLINKYKVLKDTMQDVPKDWANITSVKELSDYLDTVRNKLSDAQKILAERPTKGNEVLEGTKKRIEENISVVEEYTAKIGEMSQALAEADRQASSATKFYTEAKKANANGEEWATSQVVAQAKLDAQAARQYNAQMQSDTAKATADIKASIAERIAAITQEANAYRSAQAHVSETGEYQKSAKSVEPSEAEDAAKAENDLADARNNAANAGRNNDDATKAQIKALNQEKAAVKQSASQYYYKLRSVKMLGFVINSANTAMGNFGKKVATISTKALNSYLKLIPGVTALRKAISKTSATQSKFNKELKSNTKASNGFNMSITDGIKALLKYSIGIRSLYVLFNKMRAAMIDGLGQLAVKYSDVNKQMSSIVSSINQMKAAVTSVVQPLLNVLAPALEKIAQVVADIAYKVASFIAALTGQSFVYKATRLQTDYAASLDKTAKSAKEATKELGKYDKLNVIHQDKDSGSDDGGVGTMGFEKVPIDSTMADWAEKFKEFLDRLLGPIKKAWEKMKKFVTDAWKYMLNELKLLWQDFVRDFWRVWEEAETQRIFENIFKILGDIFLIIGNIAHNIRIAWNHNENGYRILKAIRDIVLIISEGLKDAADYTVEWSKKLSFIPLFDAIADVLEQQVVPAVQKVVDLFVYLYETIFLEIVRYVVEELAPILVKVFGNIVETIGNIAENLRKALEENDRGAKILEQVETLVTIIADAILDVSEKTKEWSKNLDFSNLLDSTLGFLEAIEPLIQFLADTLSKLWTDVLLPFWQYLIEEGFPKLLDGISEIVQAADWDAITENVNNLLDALEPFFELAWETLVQIIKDLGQALLDFLGSDELGAMIDKFKQWVNEADPQELAGKIESLVKAFIEIKAALGLASSVILPVATGFMTIMNVINQTSMIAKLGELSTKIGALAGSGGAAAGGGGFTALAASIGPVVTVILIVVGVIATMVAAFGGVENTIAEVKERFDKAKESISQFADKIGFSDTIENLKEALSNLGGSLESLRPLFELLLDVLGGIATVIIETVLGAIDGLTLAFTGIVDIVSGVSDVIGGLIDIIVNLFAGDYAKADEGLSKMLEGLGEIFLGLGEVVAGVINAIGEALAGFVNELLPGVAEDVGKFVDDVKNFFAWLRHQLIGDPIVYDIRDGVIEGFGDFVSETWDSISGWVGDIKDKFDEMKKNIGEKVDSIKTKVSTKFGEIGAAVSPKLQELKDGVVEKFTALKEEMNGESETATTETTNDFMTMKDDVVSNINDTTLLASGTAFITGFSNGVKTVWTKMVTTIKTNVTELINLFKTKFTNNTVLTQGKQFITGLYNGIKSVWATMLSDVRTKITGLINEFKSKLSGSTLVSVGRNLIEGLKDGLLSGLRSALDAVKSICSEIVSTVKSAFEVHSPSKIFYEIGEFLMQGLVNGVDSGKEEISETFESIVPDESLTDSFYNDFIDGLTDMKNNAVYIVSSMVSEIEDILGNLTYASMMNDMYSQFNKINAIKVPNIAMGQTLPSNSDFNKNNKQEIDLSKLPEIIREAMIDAISEADFSSNNQPIMLQLDSRTVAEAVWDEEEKRYKQRGDYSPLYG